VTNIANPPKKFVVSTEIYHERLNSFFNGNDSVSDAQVIMGMNAHKVSSDSAMVEEIRNGSSEDCTWPMGSICCALAHFNALQQCVQTNEPVSVFEDDAILVEDFDEKSVELLNKIDGDWDIIQWGFNWDAFMHFRLMGGEGPVFNLFLQSQIEKFRIINFKSSKRTSKLFPLVSSFGMHAYTVSPTGAKKILDFYPKISNYFVDNVGVVGAGYWCSSLDMVLNAFYDSNNAFVALPPLSYVVNDKQASAIWNPPS